MPHFKVSAAITVDTAITIEAASEAEAVRIFKDGICMTASLVDVTAANDVDEDSISDVEISSVEKMGNP